MATNYPNSIDNGTSLPYPNSTDDLSSPNLAAGQGNQNDAVIAVETLVGSNATQTTPTAQYNVLQATSATSSEWGLLTLKNVSGSTGTGSFVFATSPTISSPTISSPTISSPTITGSLGNISTGTITSSGLITGNGGATIGSTLTVNSGTTITYPTGSFSSVFLSNPYKFSVYQSTSQSLPATVSFDTVIFDTNSNFSTTTYKYTAPVTGYYLFNWLVTANFGSTTTYFNSSLVKNSGTVATISNGSNSGQFGPSVGASKLLSLNAGDTVYINTSQGAVAPSIAGKTQTYFEGFFVSAT